MYNATRLACLTARDRGTCTNRLAIRRDEVEQRVLNAMQQRLWNQKLYEEFYREFTGELNRLRGEERAEAAGRERELAKIERQIKKLVEDLKEGVPAAIVKDELIALDNRRTELKERTAMLHRPPKPLVHPDMGRLYQQWVLDIRAALSDESRHSEATSAIRAIVDEIVLTPEQGRSNGKGGPCSVADGIRSPS